MCCAAKQEGKESFYRVTSAPPSRFGGAHDTASLCFEIRATVTSSGTLGGCTLGTAAMGAILGADHPIPL